MRQNRTENIILIADDDLFVRKVLTTVLEDYATVIPVTNGAEVMAAYEEHMPDIIFLDIHLPNISGLKIMNQIQKRDPDAYIVMISADSIMDNVQKAKANGCKAFFTKPFTKDRILESLKDCASIHLPTADAS